MRKFEYKIVSVLRDKAEIALEEHGKVSWELCGVVSENSGSKMTIHLFFKRETN